MKKYKNEIDRLISETLEKPGKDDGPILFDFLFNRSAKIGQRFSMNGNKKLCSYCGDSFIPVEDEDFCSEGCENLFHEEREIEVLDKEEKKGKAIP